MGEVIDGIIKLLANPLLKGKANLKNAQNLGKMCEIHLFEHDFWTRGGQKC